MAQGLILSVPVKNTFSSWMCCVTYTPHSQLIYYLESLQNCYINASVPQRCLNVEQQNKRLPSFYKIQLISNIRAVGSLSVLSWETKWDWVNCVCVCLAESCGHCDRRDVSYQRFRPASAGHGHQSSSCCSVQRHCEFLHSLLIYNYCTSSI